MIKANAEAERRYAEDVVFRSLVDAIEVHALANGYTTHEIILAALQAAKVVEQEKSQ